LEARIGETTNTELYTLEDNFELVPGTWMLETWLGNRKLASQPFRLDNEGQQSPSRSTSLDDMRDDEQYDELDAGRAPQTLPEHRGGVSAAG
jgi:hypothetical protein